VAKNPKSLVSVREQASTWVSTTFMPITITSGL
jgi:hypothetical protein